MNRWITIQDIEFTNRAIKSGLIVKRKPAQNRDPAPVEDLVKPNAINVEERVVP